MRSHNVPTILKSALCATVLLLLGVTMAVGQQQVNLTAGPATATLPDGSAVPMWGYSCDATQVAGSTATCAKLNPAATAGTWSPVVITVPTGQNLQINLTNNLSFAAGAGTNTVPTSLVIVGQLGGGLGAPGGFTHSPDHSKAQGSVTWPIVDPTTSGAPPAQGDRVQSFSTEVAAGATTALTWTAPRPGTYLIESGTHPSIQGPMGLYGILVVTAAPTTDATTGAKTAGTAYPGVNYDADVPLLLSEIDPVQNQAVQTAVTTVGFTETEVWTRHGASGPVTSITVTSGGGGYLATPTVTINGAGSNATAVATLVSGVVTAITITNAGDGYLLATDATTPTTVTITPATGDTTGAGATATANVTLGGCGGGGAHTCYPPAVNYTPLYYLFNGVAFNRTNPSISLFAASQGTLAAPVTGNVLVRFVNAGLRMHVPSIVGALTGKPAVSGFGLIAEDGNPLPGVTRVQSEVFMAAGKTYDVMINAPQPATGATGPVPPPALPVFDRQLSLSGNSTNRDSGMLAYIGVNGAGVPAAPAFAAPVANTDTYNALVAGQTLTVSDPSKGVIANDVNIFGVQLDPTKPAANGSVTLNANGTFKYVPSGTLTSDSFGYCGNGATSGVACTTVTLGPSNIVDSGVTCTAATFDANVATYLAIKTPGILANCKDGANLPLTVATSTITASAGLTVIPDANGGFTASASGAGTYTFSFQAKNSQGVLSNDSTSTSATPVPATTVTLTFPAGSGLIVKVVDGSDHTTEIKDYRWIIEEDRTFYVDPKCTSNPLPSTCPTVTPQGTPALFGTNFHTSYMPLVATGCTGSQSCESGQTLLGLPAVCDVGNGVCRTDGSAETAVDPKQVHLDPTKRYYISVLPGDAATPFNAGYAGAPDCAGANGGVCGHGMGGAPIAMGQTSVTVLTQPSPYPPAKLTVFVFEDDWPLNGEHDAGGGIDVLSPQEPGLGGFQITLFDDAGGTGDATGQPTYDMFNMPLTNSLAGTVDPATGFDACPVSTQVTANAEMTGTAATPDQCALDPSAKGCQKGVVGMIVTCPTYESDGTTLSPLAGQALVNNLYQGRYGVVATPNADRIARGEEWLQTNTLDGQKAHDSFMRIGEPAYFQEFGPAGYHVTIGFANPKIINDRKPSGGDKEVKGHVTTARMSRPPDERLYGSGSRDSFAFTQCYASLGDPDGAEFAFTKCDDKGNFDFTGIPAGNFKLTIFDQWNDQIVDGISTPVGLASGDVVKDLGEVAVHQWQANIYTRSFIDNNGDGVSNKDAQGNDTEPGLALVATNIRFRDGSFSNFNNTDLNGYAGFNEVFPLFSWYTIETDSTRYKTTGVHVVYDSGGPTDGTSGGGGSTIGQYFANTLETNSLPSNLRVPGAVYCDNADCNGFSIATGPIAGGSSGPTANLSTGRIDPPTWFGSYGWQGFSGQNNFLEFGKKPFAEAVPAVTDASGNVTTQAKPAENGGIHGHVVYASTRPFDDPQLLLQLSWEPLVPHVKVNLYKEGVATDGVTQTLTLVDQTETSSFDDWAQGFRSDGVPNMNCPGQSTTDPFFFSLQNQPQWLDFYNNGAGHTTALPSGSQFKCYDGMHNWNQLQPAPYDGIYSFPSVTGLNPTTGKPTGTNCTACIPNPDATDPYRVGAPMLPAGKYVVEVVVPPGYELVKEEDKNILIGDNYIAPVTQQFAGLGNIFIMPDQAEVSNATNAQNSTQNLGRAEGLPSHEGDTGSVESFWPCVGQARIVPDYISLFPGSFEVAPFAGATRNLCDRKEVTLDDQTAALAKFYIFTSTHAASHFTGVITDDFTAEFDPFSPQFGEKFAPAYLPVSLKDWTGNEVARTYSDEFGNYDGLNYSTWEVNPPNPTGYGPTMMVVCMNDAGAKTDPATGLSTNDPLFQPNYSQFCYELPFMPGQTGYFDTPVVPTSAFSEGYNHPDCNYPDATPAIKSVTSNEIAGPWVSAAGTGHTLTITALGPQSVDNYGYSGPSISNTNYNQQKVTRNYDFGTAAGKVALVGSDGVPRPLTNVTWGQLTIKGDVPGGLPQCDVQQQTQYHGSSYFGNAHCGELVITNANGKQSVDTVTVTIGGTKPTVLAAGKTIQSAIDAAQPGDMIIVPPGTYSEMVLMWKPVRLQGVGAASSVIDANPHPAGKLDAWRKQVVCLFGLTPDGRPNASDTSCSSGWTAASGGPNFPTMVVDRIPLEGILGWDTTVNGNLAEQLIEPSLMGAYEGAAITVLGKGVSIPAGATDAWGSGAESAFPAGTVLLDGSTNSTRGCGGNGASAHNPYPSNFYCNPSSIDGLGLTNSSQGGGGIFVHAWGQNLQIANNRVHSNQGTMSGGITVGQGEHIDLPLAPNSANAIPPGSCEDSTVTNLGLPYCYNMHVNVHNNAVTLNSSLGDELFSSTPAGAGGVTFCNGADYYQFNYNWVCGNMSTGDGGGVAHLGWSKNGDIEHNSILFNQSTNPTITTNGGGLLVMGAPDPDPPCGVTNDKDCVPLPNEIPPSDGTGPGLVINANRILGNAADSGSGGGLRLQHVNGTDVINFPSGQDCQSSLANSGCHWNTVNVTNNIITNNVAGWDGAGVSLQDALAVNIVNNTIASNDSTASSGVLFGSLFAPLASTPGTNCTTNNGSQSCPQVAGLVSVTNTPVLVANLPSGFSCPQGHGTSGSCSKYSVPLLTSNVIWQNRSFFIGVGDFGTGTQNQQKVVTLYNSFTTTPAVSQTATGACPAASYWEIGVRGDTGPSNHSVVDGTTLTLAPTSSVLTDAADYPGANNLASNPTFVTQYCNGSRVPPELGSMGYTVNPGTNETNALPTPVFSLTPSATVDEGNNWINLRWGPLSLTNPATGVTLGNYALAVNSPAIDYVPSTVSHPSTDFFGSARPDSFRASSFDVGAVEYQGLDTASVATVTGGPLAFGNVTVSTTSAPQTLTLHNTGNATVTGITVVVTAPFARAGGSCGTSLTVAASTCTINVVFSPTVAGAATGTATITSSVTVNGSPVTLSGTGIAINRAATVAPSPLAFGNWAIGTTSTRTLTVTNTGNIGLAGGTFTFGGGTPQPFSRSGGTCGATLAVGASCTINVVFTPATATAFSRNLTVAYNPVATVTGSPVTLTGTGVATRAAVSITPNPLTITLATGVNTGTGTVTLTNSAPATGADMTVSSFAVSGGSLATFFFNKVAGADNCTGVTLTPGASCTVGVRFTNVGSARGTTRTGTITFTDNGAASPQAGTLHGFATP